MRGESYPNAKSGNFLKLTIHVTVIRVKTDVLYSLPNQTEWKMFDYINISSTLYFEVVTYKKFYLIVY